MADEQEVIAEVKEVVEAPNPFNMDNWRTEPAIPIVAEEPVVEVVSDPVEPIVEPVVEVKPDPVIAEKPVIEPIKFANDESEKIFNLLKDGKKEEVFSILSEQDKLSKVDKLAPAEAIKLNLSYQHKDFTPQEINDLFNETYELPEKPEQGDLEDDDDFKKREEKYNKEVAKVEAKIARDSKPAVAELSKLSKEIVLPDIVKNVIEETQAEPTQEELDAQKAQIDAFFKSADEEIKKLDGYNSTFKDEEVELSVGYKLTDEEKKELLPLITLSNVDAPAFLQKIGWLDDKGNLNAAKLAQDLPFILNKEKVLSGIVAETGTKRFAEAKKSIKNIDYSGRNNSGADTGKTSQQLQSEMASTFFNI